MSIKYGQGCGTKLKKIWIPFSKGNRELKEETKRKEKPKKNAGTFQSPGKKQIVLKRNETIHCQYQ